jgi:hypothetical protein
LNLWRAADARNGGLESTKMEPWRVYTVYTTGRRCPYFDDEQDPDPDPDTNLSEKLDPNLHNSDADPEPGKKLNTLIYCSILCGSGSLLCENDGLGLETRRQHNENLVYSNNEKIILSLRIWI